MNWSLFKETMTYSLASAMQQIVLQVGKAFIQIKINLLPISEQGGYNIGTKIDDYAITLQYVLVMPVQSFSSKS